MADITKLGFPLQFVEQSKQVGSLSANAKWTCHICGVKESDTGCTHLLQWLNRFHGDPMRASGIRLYDDEPDQCTTQTTSGSAPVR